MSSMYGGDFQGGWAPEGQPDHVRPDSRASHASHLTGLMDTFGQPDETFRQPAPEEVTGEAEITWLQTRTEHLHTHYGGQQATLDSINQLAGHVNTITQYSHSIHRDTQALTTAIPAVQPTQPVVPQLTGVNRPAPPPPTIQTSTTRTSGGIKLAKPDKFDGKDKSKSKAFRVAITQYLRAVYPHATVDEQILFIISYLEGAALDWLQPFQEADIDPRLPVTFLHNLQSFWSVFDKQFGEINWAENHRQKFHRIKQKKSVQDFVTGFQTYSQILGYGDTVLQDLIYDKLSDYIKDAMLNQGYDPYAPTTTLQNVMDRALYIDARIDAYKPTKRSNQLSSNQRTTGPSNSNQQDKLAKGDNVYMYGQDRRTVKGKIIDISKGPDGKNVPTVQWQGNRGTSQMPFPALKQDTRTGNTGNIGTNRVPPPPPTRDTRGPGPMDLDANSKGKGSMYCNNCKGKGHFAKDCPSKPMSGFAVEVEEPKSDKEELKDNA
ncbi:hypothetical protein FRC12_003104 [Ceratobasidium sp. 428]|nr:hypothetical protein FRC09_005314 [Ceratobasidium sp. 395]KAG8793313.1 hypothetical protein FRC12_003104 [Ceratobasidium sp. 428]